MDDKNALLVPDPPSADGDVACLAAEATLITSGPPLDLMPYQRRICEFLKRHDPDIWRWFASSKQQASHVEELKFDLLKTTYRIDPESQSALYDVAQDVCRALGLSAPITLYQAQDP